MQPFQLLFPANENLSFPFYFIPGLKSCISTVLICNLYWQERHLSYVYYNANLFHFRISWKAWNRRQTENYMKWSFFYTNGLNKHMNEQFFLNANLHEWIRICTNCCLAGFLPDSQAGMDWIVQWSIDKWLNGWIVNCLPTSVFRLCLFHHRFHRFTQRNSKWLNSKWLKCSVFNL